MTSQELTIREETSKAVANFRSPEFLEQVRYALPENESPHKFVRVLVTALMERKDLIAADRESLLTAAFKCAAMGLLPDGREAVIVVYKTKVKIDGRETWIQKCVLIPMVDGYTKIVGEYGWNLISEVIYENDEFDEGSTEKPLFHRRAKLGTDRGQPIGAFALATHPTKGFRQAIYDVHEIELVRSKSKQPQGELWTTFWDRAWKKTVAKYVAKHLPLDSKDKEQLLQRLDVEDLNDDQKIDLLYGREDRQAGMGNSSSRARVAEPARGEVSQESTSPPPRTHEPRPVEKIPDEADVFDPTADDEPPFEGEEPGAEPVDFDPATSEIIEPPTFSVGKHAGETLEEIYASGEDGVKYCAWAWKSWKQQPMRDALDAFAELHPDIKGEAS